MTEGVALHESQSVGLRHRSHLSHGSVKETLRVIHLELIVSRLSNVTPSLTMGPKRFPV